jgi:hypothetical protein
MWLQFNETRLQNLTNWPSTLRCKFLRPFKQFLIAGNLTNSGVRQPYRIRWSHPADPGSVPASWVINDPAIDAGEFDIAETSDELVDGLVLGNMFVIYKQRSTHILRIIGGNDIMARDEIIPTKGLLWRDCVQPIPGGHFCVGADDIYIHSGQRGSERSVVDDKLREWIFGQISADTYFNCFTLKWEKKNEIWFCFPESGVEYPNLVLVYNTITQGLGIKDIPNVPFMYPGPVSRGVDQDPIWGRGRLYIAGDLQASAASLQGSQVVISSSFLITGIPPGGNLEETYSFTPGTEDGVAPFVWDVSTGALPDGLTLDPDTGEISGVPDDTEGYYAFTLHCVDDNGKEAYKDVIFGLGRIISLLHMDGVNNGTSFPDETGKVWTRSGCVTVTDGAAFGGSSASFNGSQNLSIGDSADWGFGAEDFTVSVFLTRTGSNGSGEPVFTQRSTVSSNTQFTWRHGVAPATRFGLSTSGTGEFGSIDYPDPTTNVRTFYSFCRKGGRFYCHVDGVPTDGMNIPGGAATALYDSTATVKIAAWNGPGGFVGRMDEFKVSRGAAQYEENETYAVPTAASDYPV